MYYDKWWKAHNHVQGNSCSKKKSMDQKALANALGVVNIGGIFVVLLCGLAFAILIAILEFCWSKTSGKTQVQRRDNDIEDREIYSKSLCVELMDAIGTSHHKNCDGRATNGRAIRSASDLSNCREQTNL